MEGFRHNSEGVLRFDAPPKSLYQSEGPAFKSARLDHRFLSLSRYALRQFPNCLCLCISRAVLLHLPLRGRAEIATDGEREKTQHESVPGKVYIERGTEAGRDGANLKNATAMS